MFSPHPIEKASTMLPKPIARELIILIEQHVNAALRVNHAAQFHPNTNLELDEKHSAQEVKSALYKLIDLFTED